MQRVPYIYLIKTAWKFAKGKRVLFALSYLFFVIANIIVAFEPAVIGKVFDAIQRGGQDGQLDMRYIVLWLLVFGSLAFIFWVFHGTARIMEETAAFHIEKRAREYYFKVINELPLRWHKDHHSGDTHDRVEKATKSLERFTAHGFRVIEALTRGIFAVVAIVIYVPRYGFIVLAAGALVIYVILLFDKRLARYKKSMNDLEHERSAIFYDYVSNIKTIITLRLSRFARNEYSRSILRIFPIFRTEIRVNELKWFIVSMLLSATSLSLMFIYVWSGYRSGIILLGGFVALFGYASQLSDSFYRFAGLAQELLLQAVSIRATDALVKAHEALATKPPKIVDSNWKTISARNIWFKYEDKEHREHQLQDVCMEIKRGQRIALVGESGSGKSTILYLLRGLDRPARFELKIDGIAKTSFRELAAITTLIPQDPEIFENTIRFNVSAGVTRSAAEIDRAVKMARFEPVLKRLPKGLDTHIKERGVNLSGGEKQRLALARGIYAAEESSLLLLDEPTSSMDPLNELAIYKKIFEHFKDQAIISTIHRLHLLQYFDYIYVLASGKIVEQGAYDDLWRKPAGVLSGMIRQYSATNQNR